MLVCAPNHNSGGDKNNIVAPVVWQGPVNSVVCMCTHHTHSLAFDPVPLVFCTQLGVPGIEGLGVGLRLNIVLPKYQLTMPTVT